MQTAGVSEAAPAPSDYTEFWRQYRPVAIRVLARYGIERDIREDMASEVCARFFERDFLRVYDPDKVIVRGGISSPTNFQAFFNGFVSKYALGYRDRLGQVRRHEVPFLDSAFDTPESSRPAPPDVVHGLGRVEDQVYWAQAREWLAQVPRRSPQDICDLVALFDFVVGGVLERGRARQADIAAHFGVSTTAAGNWMKWLRASLLEWMETHW